VKLAETGKSAPRRLNLFVHCASELLTDHASHGDGLICFSLLNGLAERGHRIFAYARQADIRASHPGLVVRTERHRVPANTLAPAEHAFRAERWLRSLARHEPIDLVWRMHPYTGVGYPNVRRLRGLPLVIGPLYYHWPDRALTGRARPRFGLTLNGLTTPVAARGWQRAHRDASLLIASTPVHAGALRREFPGASVIDLPVIVDPAGQQEERDELPGGRAIRLIFVANLLPYKNPQIFCEIVRLLRDRGIPAEGVLLGDGPERAALEAYSRAHNLQNALCFAGRVHNSEVYRRIARADLLISLSEGEPYGRSIVEAMSVGTPCVCHRSGGPADFIEHGVDGVLIDRLDAGDYAAEIGRIAADPTRWEALSAGAARKAAGWTSEVVLTRLEAALLETVAGARPR
jgi:glycosyltransferase involved in cell wall biosynthesis